METHFISKEAYHGGELEGNQCEIFLKNCEKFVGILADEHKNFIDGFRVFKELNEAVCGKLLSANYKSVFKNFRETFMFLHTTYGLSLTPKLHIIFDHVEEYIDESGKSLGFVTDQTVEAAHQIVDKRFKSSGYFVNNVSNPAHGTKLLKGILHVNSYNI